MSGIVINNLIHEKWEMWRNSVTKTMFPGIFQDMAHTEINNNVQFTVTLATWATSLVDLKLAVPSQAYRSPHRYPAASGTAWVRTVTKLLPIYSMIVKALSDLGISWKLERTKRRVRGIGMQKSQETADTLTLVVISHLYAAAESIIPYLKPLVQDVFWKTILPILKR